MDAPQYIKADLHYTLFDNIGYFHPSKPPASLMISTSILTAELEILIEATRDIYTEKSTRIE
jgi:hypothetical protein